MKAPNGLPSCTRPPIHTHTHTVKTPVKLSPKTRRHDERIYIIIRRKINIFFKNHSNKQ